MFLVRLGPLGRGHLGLSARSPKRVSKGLPGPLGLGSPKGPKTIENDLFFNFYFSGEHVWVKNVKLEGTAGNFGREFLLFGGGRLTLEKQGRKIRGKIRHQNSPATSQISPGQNKNFTPPNALCRASGSRF